MHQITSLYHWIVRGIQYPILRSNPRIKGGPPTKAKNKTRPAKEDKRTRSNQRSEQSPLPSFTGTNPFFSRVSLDFIWNRCFHRALTLSLPPWWSGDRFFFGGPTHKYSKINTRPANPKQASSLLSDTSAGHRCTRVIKRRRSRAPLALSRTLTGSNVWQTADNIAHSWPSMNSPRKPPHPRTLRAKPRLFVRDRLLRVMASIFRRLSRPWRILYIVTCLVLLYSIVWCLLPSRPCGYWRRGWDWSD